MIPCCNSRSHLPIIIQVICKFHLCNLCVTRITYLQVLVNSGPWSKVCVCVCVCVCERWRPTWTYILRQNIIPIAKDEKDLRVMIQDNLSSEKHIDIIFGDTFRMLRNIWIAFHFLDKDMRKIITATIITKLEYAEVIWSHHK